MQVSNIFSLGGDCGGYGGGGYSRHSDGGYSRGHDSDYSNYRGSYRYKDYGYHNGGGLLSIRIGGGRGRDY